VFGSNLSPVTESAPSVPLPLLISGVEVLVNGIVAPLYYVAPGQLNVQIPYETAANSSAVVSVNVVQDVKVSGMPFGGGQEAGPGDDNGDNGDDNGDNGGGDQGGATPHWRGILDDKGRVMVAMSFNSDIGDSWEWADDPEYPEKYSALGIRIGVNYVIYSLTH